MDDKQENLLPSSLPSQLLSIDEELWRMIEERAQEILWTIQPNVLSEVNRKNIIDYVQRLIGEYCGAQVFPFGSFPLKTYLPDGDIDLTALSHEDEEEDLVRAVCNILKSEDDSEYQVKDIEHIRAQVQVVKCTVKNIPVDISFNQMAGLYTLFFLEQVDQLVGKNHIFKRSVILIKSWCYYESRILGAHCGLLSTYATEILVLYIINRFHSSVRGPLAVSQVFYRQYSLHPFNIDTPEYDQGEFLLQKEFLKNYRDMCSSKAKASETMTNAFPVKHMNILDPLRNNNNLGRSVNIGNLSRIRLAFSLGSQRLKQILTLAGENMGAALEKFFFNTLENNGKGERADVGVPVSPFGTGRFEESVLSGDYDSYYGWSQYVQQYPNYAMPVTTVPSHFPSPPHQDNILALSTQLNWSEGDFPALSAQQNWSMFYQSGTNVYIPGQTLFHPTYSLGKGGRSRGTGTYIPDLSYNCYWDIHAKANRPRRFPYAKHNALLKSSPKSQQEKEFHTETKPFELSDEDFPLIPNVYKATPPTQAQESTPLTKVHSETDKDGNSRLSELLNEDFPLPLSAQVKESAPLAKVLSKTNMDGNSRSFELSNEDFPLLQRTHK
ncbi:Poly(A) RNA polymerase cid14 [Glycine max]|nr:Poly(A) RNA polymerase cid14 [Glycine max]